MTSFHQTTRVLDGRALGQRWLAEVATRVGQLARPPRLVIVQVGELPSSSVYVARKLAAAAQVGIAAEVIRLAVRDGETALHTLLHGLAQDPDVDALLVQTPLPPGWDVQRALDAVPWAKDVDGLSRASAERRAERAPCHLPATPAAVCRVLREELGLKLAGLPVAVIGNGRVVGAPLRHLLQLAGAEVIAIDRDTPHPAALSRRANVVVAACGVPGLVTEAWVQPGAVVIDVGLTPEEQGGKTILRGDVEALRVEGVATVRTPAPGGVGPLTVAQLLANVAKVFEFRL